MTQYNPQRHHRRSVRLRGYDYSRPGAYFVTINVRDGACVLGDVVEGRVQLTEVGDIAYRHWAQVPARFPHVSIDGMVVMPNHVHAIVMIHEGAEEGAEKGAMTAPQQPDDGRGGVIPPQTAPQQPDDGRGGVIPPQAAPQQPNDRRGGVIPPHPAPQPRNVGRGGVLPPCIPSGDPTQRERPTLGQIVAYYKYETTRQINDLCGNDPMPFWQRSFYDHIIRDRRGLDAIRKYIADNPLHWERDRDHPWNASRARTDTG